jgi:glycosyltransferase involved in cell wall biosynthesis
MRYESRQSLERSASLMKQAKWDEAFLILQSNYDQNRTEIDFIRLFLRCCLRIREWRQGIRVILNDLNSHQVLINPGEFLQKFLIKGGSHLSWNEVSEIEQFIPLISAVEKHENFQVFMKRYTSIRDGESSASDLISSTSEILIDCTQLLTGVGTSGIPRTIQSILHNQNRIRPVYFDSVSEKWILMDHLPNYLDNFFPKVWGDLLDRSCLNAKILLIPYSRAKSNHLDELKRFVSEERILVIPIFHDGIPILHPELETGSKSDLSYHDFFSLLDIVQSIFFVSKKSQDDYLEIQSSRGISSYHDQNFYILGNSSILIGGLSKVSSEELRKETKGNLRSNAVHNEFEILFVGSFTSKRKNLFVLLRAIANLSITNSIVVNIVSTWGPHQNFNLHLEKILKDMDLSEGLTLRESVRICHFHQPEDDVLIDLYKKVHLVCIPSRQEGFGLPFLEACAAGKEILVSSGGVAKDVADSFQFTNLLDPSDYIKWRDEIIKVIQRKESGIQDSNIAIRQEIAKSLYSVQTFQEKLFHSIETVISSKD